MGRAQVHAQSIGRLSAPHFKKALGKPNDFLSVKRRRASPCSPSAEEGLFASSLLAQVQDDAHSSECGMRGKFCAALKLMFRREVGLNRATQYCVGRLSGTSRPRFSKDSIRLITGVRVATVPAERSAELAHSG